MLKFIITVDDTKPLKGLIWHRASAVFKNQTYKIYDQMNIEDIHQGVLGNCYFLSSLSAIAESHSRLQKLIENSTVSPNGCYALKVFVQGKQKTIVIDDYFPVFKNKKFAMAFSGPNEIWVQLFEKMWAKLNSSYTMTIAGLPSEALSVLTEAPVITYIHRKYEPDDLWKIIKQCDDDNYIICTTTNNSTASQDIGLVQSHAYTLISAYEIDSLKLLKIRNPWGSGFEWNGDFGDKSSRWTSELKAKVKFEDTSDGIFYMTFSDFLKYYPYTFVCKYYDRWNYKYKKIEQTSDSMVGLKFKIDTPTKAIFGLHQKQERFYNKVKNYTPCYAKVFLVKYSGYNFEFIHSNEGTTDKIYLDLEKPLEPGDYYLFAKVKWNYYKEDTCSNIFSVYSDNAKLEFLPIDRQAIRNDYLTKIFDSYISKKCTYKDISDKKDGLSYVISLNDTDTGFFWLSFKNNNPVETCKVSFAAATNDKVNLLSKNLSIQKLNNQNIYSVMVPPNSSELVLFEQLDNVWLCKISLSPLQIEWDGGVYQPEIDKTYIAQNLSKATKETIVENELFYRQLVKDNSLLLIVQNESPYDFMVKTNLTKMINCSVSYPLSMNLKVYANSFEFIKIVPTLLDKIDFSFVYSYKNLSKEGGSVNMPKENGVNETKDPILSISK